MSINTIDIYDFGAWIDLAPRFDWSELGGADAEPSGTLESPLLGPISTAGTASTDATSLDVPRPEGLSDGDYVVVAARSMDGATAVFWTAPAGFVLVTADSGGVAEVTDRMGGVWVKPVTDAAAEPATYAFSGPTGRNVAISVALNIGSIGTPERVSTARYGASGADGVPGTVPASTLTRAPALALVAMGAELDDSLPITPTTLPAGFTEIGMADSGASTSGTTTAIWLGWRYEPDVDIEEISGGYADGTARGIYLGAFAEAV